MSLAELEQVAREVSGCTRCPLHRGRTQSVPGEGPPGAEIVFIGEAPGYNEDRTGRPFVGQAGRLLEDLLASIGLKRSDVFICNVVKCRPANNRDPYPAEIEACRPYLDRQLAAIQPRLVVTLGRYSMARYIPGESISRVHGQARRVGETWVLPMFHPAAALHKEQYRSLLQQDFGRIPALLDRVRAGAAAAAASPDPAPVEPAPPPAQQMPLFE